MRVQTIKRVLISSSPVTGSVKPQDSVNLAGFPKPIHMGSTVSAHLSKAEHSSPLISCQLAPWHAPPHPLCISESWLIVATSEAPDYTLTTCRFQRTTATDLRQQRQIALIARPTHHSYIRPISGDCWRERIWGGPPSWGNRFGPYVFCRIIPLYVAGVMNYYYRAGQTRTELSFAVFIMIYFTFGFCGKRIKPKQGCCREW